MKNTILIALRVTLFTLLLTGIAYPLAATGLSQAFLHAKANGSLVEVSGKVVGSELIGQSFASPGYLQPRPSAAGEKGYDATSSSGSNLGPTSAKLRDRINADIDRLHQENPGATDPVPDELLTTSASGLDPHLSPAAAAWQVPRIAAARKIAPERVQAVLNGAIEERDLGIFGEPRVNVLLANVALDQRFGQPPAPAPSSSSASPPPGPATIAADPLH
jgi:potassium-transporting ATPase KdpC subunit